MTFFERCVPVTRLSESEVEELRDLYQEIHAQLSMFDMLSGTSNDPFKSLAKEFRGNFLTFMMYLSNADGRICEEEVAVMNRILDKNILRKTYREAVRRSDSEIIASQGPLSVSRHLRMTTTVIAARFSGNAVGSEIMGALESSMQEDAVDGLHEIWARHVVDLYALIGRALIAADDRVRQSEAEKFIAYIDFLNQRLRGDGAELPDRSNRSVQQIRACF